MSQVNTTPNVFVDFLLEKDLLYCRICNHSDVGASRVTVSFNKNIYFARKKEKLNQLQVFEKLLYLAPQKEIKFFVDQIDHFLQNNKRPLYRLRIRYKDENGKKDFSKTILHDLNIYRDLPILLRKE